MKYYAVIDTNVLVSAALKWDSVPGSIIDLTFSGVIVPLMNQVIMNEYKEVLMCPKFHLTKEIIHDILDEFDRHALYINEQHLDIDIPDSKDRVFYEATMEKLKSDNAYLVTGNIKHFPKKPYVVTPREMLNIVLSDINET